MYLLNNEFNLRSQHIHLHMSNETAEKIKLAVSHDEIGAAAKVWAILNEYHNPANILSILNVWKEDKIVVYNNPLPTDIDNKGDVTKYNEDGTVYSYGFIAIQ